MPAWGDGGTHRRRELPASNTCRRESQRPHCKWILDISSQSWSRTSGCHKRWCCAHFCRTLWSWDGQVSSAKSWHNHAEEAFTELWRELQRSFGFQITLPRPLPEVQDTGVPACTHLSELGEHQFISLGPWTQMGLREEGESLDRIIPNLLLWILPFLFIYLFI